MLFVILEYCFQMLQLVSTRLKIGLTERFSDSMASFGRLLTKSSNVIRRLVLKTHVSKKTSDILSELSVESVRKLKFIQRYDLKLYSTAVEVYKKQHNLKTLRRRR